MLLDGAMAWLGAGLVRWGGSQRHARPGSPMSSPRARRTSHPNGLEKRSRRKEVSFKNPRPRHLFLDKGNRSRVRTYLPSFPFPKLAPVSFS